MPLTQRTYKLSDIDSIADWIVESIPPSNVVCFEGELGAGKTTLIKAICKRLGVRDNVSSPTYSLLNIYAANGNTGFKNIVHIDLYRLTGEEEAIRAGIEEYLYSGDCCLVEWPQRAPGILPDQYMSVKLSVLKIDERLIEVSSA